MYLLGIKYFMFIINSLCRVYKEDKYFYLGKGNRLDMNMRSLLLCYNEYVLNFMNLNIM